MVRRKRLVVGKVCVECGDPAKRFFDGGSYPLCDHCAEGFEAELEERQKIMTFDLAGGNFPSH